MRFARLRRKIDCRFGRVLILGAALLLAARAGFCANGSPALQAGVARVNITPPLEMKAILGGYGERMSKPAVGVHDSVWAKALVIKQGERQFALVTVDILGFPPG